MAGRNTNNMMQLLRLALLLWLPQAVVTSSNERQLGPFRAAPKIVALHLVEAKTGKVVTPLINGTIVRFSDYAATQFTIVASTNRKLGVVYQVHFGWNQNTKYRTDRMAPYTLCGDAYAACLDLQVGNHSVAAMMGRRVASRYSVHFQVVAGGGGGGPSNGPTSPNRTVVPLPPRLGTTAPASAPRSVVSRPTRSPVRPSAVAPTGRGPVPMQVAPMASPHSILVPPPMTSPEWLTVQPSSTALDPSPASPSAAPILTGPTVANPSTRSPHLLPINDTNAPAVAPSTHNTLPPSLIVSVAPAAPPTPTGPTVAAPATATVPLGRAPRAAPSRPAAPRAKALAPMVAPVPVTAPVVAPVPVMVPVTAPVVAPVPVRVPTAPVVRINCGGAAPYTDRLGRVWQADQYFVGGLTFDSNVDIAGTDSDALYNCERYGESVYSIPVPPGSYSVTLHLAEIFHTTAGKRVFDVTVEGQVVADLDIVKLGGGVAFKAITRVVPAVVVTDGFLTLQFANNVPLIDLAKISAIEVQDSRAFVPTRAPVANVPVSVPKQVATLAPIRPSPVSVPKQIPTRAPIRPAPIVSTDNAPFAPMRINCGGATAYTDGLGRVWQADRYFVGGLTFDSNVDIAGTDSDALYNCERYGESIYSIPVPPGSYTVTLHLAEIFHTTAGKRVFDVTVEGQVVADLDIVKLGGGVAFKAITRVVPAVVVTDGFLTLQFANNIPLIDLAKISAIEVQDSRAFVPTRAPVAKTPIAKPVSPVPAPIKSPSTRTNATFSPILISCGGAEYTDNQGRVWSADKYFQGGYTFFNGMQAISSTSDDVLYQGERFGIFSYEIPVPSDDDDYEVVLHFSEVFFTLPRSRVFDVFVEDKSILDIDIIQQSGGRPYHAITREVAVNVKDGFVSIKFAPKNPAIRDPKISAIEIRKTMPHYSHAVTGGPYVEVDSDGDGFAVIPVDASQSHTHGPGQILTSFVWKEGRTILGTGMQTSLNLPVGVHDITLTVVDSSGDWNADVTTIEVKPNGFPVTKALFPNTGDVSGGGRVVITGLALSTVTAVRFGLIVVSGPEITVLNATAISVKVPASGFGIPVSVSVTTTVGESNKVPYTYVDSAPIAFTVEKLLDFATPSAVAFGPDGKLYVGSTNGQLGRFTLNDRYDKVVSSVIATIEAGRGIHGIAFDPMETAELGVNLNCYISTSRILHPEFRNSFGEGINGKIQAVKGANLDQVTNIVTGLPVSELDHAVNGISFGDNGELYIAVGSNTNGGIPGELSTSRLMRENYFSAAILVANLGQPGFDGFIQYSAPIDGDPIAGFGTKGVEVFASGLRNPYGLLFHSNGKLYGTENGPNPGFGDMATGCGVGQQIPDAYEVDELNLYQRGGYYGHPNFKRAAKDPRQCVWRAASLASVDGYTAPLMKLTSSTDGIIEFESDHFKGQMRGDLILSKYTDGLFRVILSADGTMVNPNSDPAIALTGDNGLAVTQAPDGSLVDARYDTNNCFVFRPHEAPSTAMDIKAVFPRRGALAGGTQLSIFGVNFAGPTAVVTVGGRACTKVVHASAQKLECTVPPGVLGAQNVVVTMGGQSDTFVKGYRYITGRPAAV